MKALHTWICATCRRAHGLRASQIALTPPVRRRPLSSSSPLWAGQSTAPKDDDGHQLQVEAEEEAGAMSRRLSGMAEETFETGSRSNCKLMEDAGFSERLKEQLQARIAQTAFKAQHQQTIAEVNLPVCLRKLMSRPPTMSLT